MAMCSIENCPRLVGAHGARGWCRTHYEKWRKYGDPLAIAERGQCKQDGCNAEIVISRNQSGLCGEHFNAVSRKRWWQANPDYQKRWLEAHPNYVKDHSEQWRLANPDRRADQQAIRRARKVSQFVERVYRSVVFKRDQGVCGICGTFADPDDWHLDHVIPLARGGEHSYANTQVSHPTCNVKKGAQILKESHH